MENQDSSNALVEKVPVENPDVQSIQVVVDAPNRQEISHHSVLSDHQLEVDGVIYRELKTLNGVVSQDGPDAGKDEQVLVHTRSIGDKSYTVKKSDPSNEETEEVVEGNNWTSDEKHAFLEDWDKNWNPSIDQPKEGGVIGFFKKMFRYE